MSENALKQELARVRKLKRAAESEIELLRSDMESGLIHIRINEDIKPQIAEALCEIFSLDYDSNDCVYYTDGSQIVTVFPRQASSEFSSFKSITLTELMVQSVSRYYNWDEWDNKDLEMMLGDDYALFNKQMADAGYDDLLFFLKEEKECYYENLVKEQRKIAYEFFLREIPDEYTTKI